MTKKLWSAVLLALLTISCSDTDHLSPTPAALQDSDLTFLRFQADAYQAAEKSGSILAVRGQTRTLTLSYADNGEQFLSFEVGPNTLVDVDSVRITVNVDASGNFVFHFAPSGLRFNPQAPAVLSLNRRRTSEDIDGDGDVDTVDALQILTLGIFKRELPLTPWLKLPSITLGSVYRTDVHDFTSFGMAVD